MPEAATKQSPAFSCPFSAGAHAEKGHIYFQPRFAERRKHFGLGIWGVINLMEGYGNDNPGAKSQGMKQLMAGGGVALIGTTLVPLLTGLFG